MKRVYIYNDLGVGERSLEAATRSFRSLNFEVAHIGASEVLHKDWHEDALLFVMPGGADLPYCQKLNGSGTAKIKSYVESGGKYLGFCAGAYFGSGYVEFEKGHELEVLGERELKFFPGKTIGPAYGLGTYDYKWPKDGRAAQVSFVNDASVYCIYYSGGCYFEQPEKFSNVKVVARFQDINGNPAAAVLCSVGKGKVLLSGVHPEFSLELIREKGIDKQEVVLELSTKDDSREIYLKRYLQEIDLPIQ
ncbi:MAG: biotin--protein ligase [Deltaproteobacteria bacterium]|nr:biotin--protein ligase [Deltaproteobacteria bacterium]